MTTTNHIPIHEARINHSSTHAPFLHKTTCHTLRLECPPISIRHIKLRQYIPLFPLIPHLPQPVRVDVITSYIPINHTNPLLRDAKGLDFIRTTKCFSSRHDHGVRARHTSLHVYNNIRWHIRRCLCRVHRSAERCRCGPGINVRTTYAQRLYGRWTDPTRACGLGE